MPTPGDMPSRRTERVLVLIDYENVRRSANDGFLGQRESHRGVVDPVGLAEEICGRRKRPSTLARVHVYRGRPSAEHQPKPRSYFDRYAALWRRDERCVLKARDLKYRRVAHDRFDDGQGFTAQEKGIDVWLAVDLIAEGIANAHDAIVVMSSDTDLVPAIEYVRDHTGTHVELACWNAPGIYPMSMKGPDGKGRRPFCHFLGAEVFDRVCQDSLFD